MGEGVKNCADRKDAETEHQQRFSPVQVCITSNLPHEIESVRLARSMHLPDPSSKYE